ncbi:MAG: TIGR01777 family oxidoreductase [Gammaproteobacteria bacterium]
MSTKSVLITGGTGFLGRALTNKLIEAQFDVTILTRSLVKAERCFGRKVKTITQLTDLPDAGRFAALVNLAGAGIFDRRWSDSRKKVLRDSRIDLTEQLVSWISRSKDRPGVLINGSAIGYYGDQGDEILNEDSTPVPDFSQRLCADWEAAASRAELLGTRVCLVRTGLVLGKGGGILQRMLLPFRFGLGGRMGDGNQWMSWVHIDDWVAIVMALIADSNMRGAYNATAPTPVTNQVFSATLAKVLNRPMLMPMPAFVLRSLLGEMAELILGSQRVQPTRMMADHFQFRYSHLDVALRDIIISG